MTTKVAFVTGSSKRVGAITATRLHQVGMNVAIHYGHSQEDAHILCQQLNKIRPRSATMLQADLRQLDADAVIDKVISAFGRLDVLVNNASAFYPTPLGQVSEQTWDDLFASNAKAPFFLAQAAAPHLTAVQGCIVNMIDIHADRPLTHFNVYGMAKAALAMMTKSLAKDLAPAVRVNGVAPGMILWPDDDDPSESVKEKIIQRIALKRCGNPKNIADTILFLIENDYITGQIIAVDGGRLLSV